MAQQRSTDDDPQLRTEFRHQVVSCRTSSNIDKSTTTPNAIWPASRKLGYEDREADDAFASSDAVFAIADAAAQSYLSGRWARRLVERCVSLSDIWLDVPIAVRETCAEWSEVLAAYVAQREESGRPIKFYEEPKLALGSHATLLVAQGAVSLEGGQTVWRVIGVGDSCIFRVSKEAVTAAVPITQSIDFDTAPALISSLKHAEKEPDYLRAHGTWVSGDRLFMLTDAVAQWLLRGYENGDSPWSVLESLDEASFRNWVDEERRLGRMRDDDVTVTRIVLEEASR